jgi:hypothetical protein
MMMPLAAAFLVACQPTIGDAPPVLGGGGSGADAGPGGGSERPDAAVFDEVDAGGFPGDGDDGDDGDDDLGVQLVTLSQNTDDVILAEHSVGCVQQDGDGNPVQNRENSYYRLFDLEDEGVDGDLDVTEVHVGIESARTADDSAQPITVRLHQVDGEFIVANMTELASTELDVEPQTGTILDVPLTARVDAGSQLAVEVFVPNSTVVGRLFFIGSNDAGQTAPSFIRAPLGNCAIAQPTDFADVPPGFPDVHIILSVSGETIE